MQVEIVRRTLNGAVRFFVVIDGREVSDFGTFALADQYADRVWSLRSEADKHWARADYGLRGQELRASAAFIAELMQRVEDMERTGTTTATPSPACWAAGVPVNLAAAAEDADEWLALIERLNEAGRWQFSERDTLSKLQGCRRALRSHLRALSEVEQNHDTPA
jgi:hypothetical protein